MILTRRDLYEAIFSAVVGAVLLAAAYWFRSQIETYIGNGATHWLLLSLLVLYCLSLLALLNGWKDIRSWERAERTEKERAEREQAEYEASEKRSRLEYEAFLSWVRHNPHESPHLVGLGLA